MNLRSLVNFGIRAFIVLFIIVVAYTLVNSGDSMHWAMEALIENVFRLVGLGILAIVVGWKALERWKIQHFTKEWDLLVRFLSDENNAGFMDPNKTSVYKIAFSKDNELIRYEMVARMCFAFLDDMFYQKYYSDKVNDWYTGSFELFAGRHWQWYTEHLDSYSEDFQQFLEDRVAVDKRNIV